MTREGNAQISAEQLRGARAFLNWSLHEAAAKAGLSIVTIMRNETPDDISQSPDTISKIRFTYEAAGITFLTADAFGSGVRLLNQT